MVMKKDGRKRDIKSKLVAAVCMLLVSCIMMVSSTYAWFTLSTAPEVTGITTAIGANGNLEMALLPNGETVAEALAAIGNANGNEADVNLTWGNLVNLSDAKYGLNKITLFPSKLNATGNVLTEGNYLGTPTYGADGRWNGGYKNTSYKTYNGSVFADDGFGVRGVGTASGMSALETAFRNNLSVANTALQNAIAASKTAISNGGSSLASMAVGQATATSTYNVTAEQIIALGGAYGNIETALNYMETALRNYIIADYLSRDGAVTETTYAGVLTQMEAVTELAGMKDYANDAMDGYVDTLVTLKSNVASHKSALAGMTNASYPFDDVKGHITVLADLNKMLLNGHPMSYWMEKTADGTGFKNLGQLVTQMSNLVMEVNAGTQPDDGIFAQMADFVDTFTTTAVITGIEYNGISTGDDGLTVNMKVNATVASAYLPASKAEANSYTQGVFGSGTGGNLTDFYGYILDMAFRTNAADSYLQLQTEGVDRVYADNESNPVTMGGGSTMIFTVPAGADFPSTKMINLMSYIRVVFFNPANGEIYGYARLDSTDYDLELTDGANEANGYKLTMKLRMWDNAANPESGAGGWAANQTIAPMVQNTAMAVSSLVYLDGETLTNADVANVDFTGTMNLQFSSSAELKPMEYGDLRNGNTETPTNPANPTATQMTGVSVNDGYTTTAAFTGNNIAMSIANTDGTETVTVVIGSSTYDAQYNSDSSLWVVVDVAETLAADTVVNVTVSEAAGG